ncbi:hypothetical protein LCGC14_1110460 [marine sediment metagenome]|uniref:Uncharacterized protein n=1 Tax=marine sediment metagenome TaxID=412755 RepID=A0A0F9QCZ6_9ZZZZ|nr:hypothetical protein [archaeon]HEC40662.1 hypothetical protein [bacterium]
MCKCKRCGKELRSVESVKRGFGATCYRIFKLQEANNSEVKPEINQEIAFLKMEIKMLKRMIRNIHVKGIVEPIERIKQDNQRPERTENTGNMTSVVKEMKKIFTENFNYRDILKSVNPIEEPVIPPIMVGISA